MNTLHRLTYTTAIILTICCFPAHGLSIGNPHPYTMALDDALFVMLPGHCEKNTEVLGGLTKNESDILREQIEVSLIEKRNNLSSMRTLDSCAHENASRGFGGQSGYNPGLWELRINTFKWKSKTSLINKAGILYPVSGLYPANDSVIPIWSVDWYERKVFLSRDGRYLVRMGLEPETRHDLAVAFYDRGKLLHAYSINDLIRNPDDITRSARFGWASDVYLDHEKGIFYGATPWNIVYEFDITTGQLAHSGVIEYPSYTAEVEALSGEQYTLFDFMTEDGYPPSTVSEPWLFESSSQKILGLGLLEPDSGDVASKFGLVGFAFSTISQLARENNSNNDEVFWRVKTKSGDEHVIKVKVLEKPPYWFTGKTSSGETKDILPQDINNIVFHPP